MEVMTKNSGMHLSAWSLTSYRFFIGAMAIFPFAIPSLKKHRISLKEWAILAYPGIINICFSMLFLQLSIVYGKASLSAILISSNSLFVAFFGWLILKEKLVAPQFAGMVIGLLGLAAIVFSEPQIFNSGNIGLGIIFGILASITLAYYTVISKKYIIKFGSSLFFFVAFFSGSITLFLASLVMGEDMTLKINLNNILRLFYLGVIVSGLAYVLYFNGLKKISTTTGAMMFMLKPIIAAFLAHIFLHEKLNKYQLIGLGLVILGLSVNVFGKKLYEKK
jgi:drug/metabolite transporter (DMT)-like permease